MGKPPTLYQISYSPYSEKARWALDHHRIAYRRVEYVPMVSTPALRLRAKRLRGQITVPVLLAGGQSLGDSFEIGEWADANGSGAPLFPKGREAEIRLWNERAEALMRAGRARVTARTARSPEARREAIPSWARPFGPAAKPLVTLGLSYFVRKYDLNASSEARQADAMREVLGALAGAVRGSSSPLLGSFSFADIAMAASLQFLRPVADRFVTLGPGTRDAWTDPELAPEAEELLRWRDAIYDQYR